MRPMHTNWTCIFLFSRSENITDNGFVIELYSDVNVQNSNSKNGKITIKARSGQSLWFFDTQKMNWRTAVKCPHSVSIPGPCFRYHHC